MVVDLLFLLEVEQQLTIHIQMWTYIRGGQYVNLVAAIGIVQTGGMDRPSSYPIRNCLMILINMALIVNNFYPEVNVFYSIPSTLPPLLTKLFLIQRVISDTIPILFLFKNIGNLAISS